MDPLTQSFPKLTRDSFSLRIKVLDRVSTLCVNNAIRVSSHNSFPNKRGEFVQMDSTGPAMACAQLYDSTKSPGAI